MLGWCKRLKKCVFRGSFYSMKQETWGWRTWGWGTWTEGKFLMRLSTISLQHFTTTARWVRLSHRAKTHSTGTIPPRVIWIRYHCRAPTGRSLDSGFQTTARFPFRWLPQTSFCPLIFNRRTVLYDHFDASKSSFARNHFTSFLFFYFTIAEFSPQPLTISTFYFYFHALLAQSLFHMRISNLCSIECIRWGDLKAEVLLSWGCRDITLISR